MGDAQPLISNGIGALEKEIDANPDVVKAVIAATLKGVDYVSTHPDEAVKLSADYVPDLKDSKNAADALEVLQATIPLFKTSGTAGTTDPNAWTSMEQFLEQKGQIDKPVDASQSFSNEYLP